ncbi:hypothetical protein ElyMa_000248200 [Elysia marginata]|uniref:Uncharacterized protein n=1 Tax=Elysia marginata TaxID=1093978 RepID=A0AAV4F3D3_9GAST|nr:hypothetical protein ElyMa_000248200 [Elysia marginata]
MWCCVIGSTRAFSVCNLHKAQADRSLISSRRLLFTFYRPVLWSSGKTRHSLRDREVHGSIPGRVKPRTLKLAADPPIDWHYAFSAKSGRPGVRIMGLGVVYASAPYTTMWQHAFNCPKPSAVTDITLHLKRDVKIQTT